MGGTTTWLGMGISVPSLAPNKSALFPGVCKMANGDVIMTTPRMTNHLYGDGEIWKQTGTDNGNGTVTWRGDWVKIYAAKGATWDCRSALCSLVPSGTHAGKVVVAVADTNWLSSLLRTDYLSPWPTVSVQCFGRILISTDTTCSAFTELATLPPAFPALDPNWNDFPESPVVFLPNGDWMVATYSRETHDYIGWYSSATFRSTDEGATWTHEGFVARANTANPNQATAQQADEPQLLMLANGDLLCVIRWLDEGRNPDGSNGYHHKLYRCSNPTARGAMTWVSEGDCTVTPAASRPALLQHSSGMIIHGYRGVVGGFSVQGIYRSSNDNGYTWTTERNLDNGAVTSGALAGSIYSYGAWVELSNGGLIHEYSQDNSPATNSLIREARIAVTPDPTAAGYGNTVSAGYGAGTTYAAPAVLTIDPASTAWEQLDTQIIVRVTATNPAPVTALISGTDGGLVRFQGTDASRFQISLDGTTWASAVDIPGGDTTIHLRVTPEAPGTTLTAQIGVPI